MSEPCEESGAQLVARLSSMGRPDLNRLDEKIFPNSGLQPNDIVEISGDVGLGKTTLMMEIIAKTILPLECGGKNGQVVLLLTEHNFDLEKLINVMNKCVGECFTDSEVHESEIEFLRTSLLNLTIQRCFHETHFELAIQDLHTILRGNHRLCLLAVDNIGAYYYGVNTEQNQTSYLNNWLEKFDIIVRDYHLAMVYTKPAYFVQKSTDKRTPKNLKYFLELVDKGNDSSTEVNLQFRIDIPTENIIRYRNYAFDCLTGCIEWNK